MKRGRYYKSYKEFLNNGGTPSMLQDCCHVSGSVAGMRKQFWGYACDVVRRGNYIYRIDWSK